jgi:hypothetical protein
LVDWLNFSYDTQQMLPVMANLRKQPEMPTLAQPAYGGRGVIRVWRHGDPSTELRAVITEKTDGDFWIGAGRFFTRSDVQYELTDPNGQVMQTGLIRKSSVGAERFKLFQMKDGVQGDYTFRIFGPDEYQLESTQISSLGTQRFVLPEKLEKDEYIISGRLFFYVPPECEKFAFTVAPIQRKDRPAQLEIISPDDKPLVSKSFWVDAGRQVVEVAAPAAWRGKVWSVAARNCNLIDVQGVPRWLAASYRGADPAAKP